VNELLARIHSFLQFFLDNPPFRTIARCTAGEHWQTLRELVAGLFWSMMPIWVGTFVAFAKGPSFDWQGFHVAFGGTVVGGELFIYAAAFLAPIFWIVHNDPPGAQQFPTPLAHTTLTAIITVFAAIAFALQKAGNTEPNVNPRIIHSLSILFFWVAVLLIYSATLYNNHRLPSRLPQEIRSQEAQFVDEYKQHREQQ
jgi:hypothetical protein